MIDRTITAWSPPEPRQRYVTPPPKKPGRSGHSVAPGPGRVLSRRRLTWVPQATSEALLYGFLRILPPPSLERP